MNQKLLLEKAKYIKLVATDIDGVWTDSKMYYSEKGVLIKSFSTYDGMGSHLLLKNNFILVMITSEYENLDILYKRAEKLNIEEIYADEKNKLKRLKYLLEKYNLKKENIAYIGDDLNDLEALKFVGLSGAPKKTPILNYYNPDFITTRKSGEGAFREFADLILKSQNINPKF